MAEDAMPNLTRDAVDAHKMGMTYGQYMAYKQDMETQHRQTAPLKHERLPVCVCCGKAIPKGSRTRKYCSPECANRAHEKQNYAAKKRRKERALELEYKRCDKRDFWFSETDPRCMCTESQWAGCTTKPDNYCMHFIAKAEET